MMFHTEYSEPTAAQYQEIGRVSAGWAIVESDLEEILARMAYSPSYFGRALTNDLSPDNRARALRALCDIHEYQLESRIVTRTTVSQLRNIAKEFLRLKQERNRIIHWICMRIDDKRLFFTRLRSRPAIDHTRETDSMTRTNSQLEETNTQIRSLADEMESVFARLPDLPWP